MRDDPMPEFQVVPHDAGLAIGASRRADGTGLYRRVSQFLTPNHGLAPNAFAGENYHGQTWVPITDERWVPLRNRDNDYLSDREDQKLRTFTGIRGISEQDACIQDSQGFIADRTREHLGPTDAAIIQFRRLMLGAARDLRGGVEPAAARNGAAYTVRSGSALADRSVAFAEVMVQRFGDAVGRVHRGGAGAQASSATYSSPPSSLRR